MQLYGFWRSLATYRVNVGLALKGVAVEKNVSIDLLKGEQLNADYKAVNPQAVVPSLVGKIDRADSYSDRTSSNRPTCARCRARLHAV